MSLTADEQATMEEATRKMEEASPTLSLVPLSARPLPAASPSPNVPLSPPRAHHRHLTSRAVPLAFVPAHNAHPRPPAPRR